MIEFQHVFGDRKKGKHGLISNLSFSLRSSREFDKKLFYYQLIPIIPTVAASYLGTLIPSEVVRSLQEHWEVGRMVTYICFLTFVMLVCNMAVVGMDGYVSGISNLLTVFFNRKCFRKMMGLDYDLLEGQNEQKLIGNAWRALRNNYNFRVACMAFPKVVSSALGVIFYGIVIGRKNVILVFLMMISVTVSMKLLSIARRKHKEYHEELSRYAREAAYISKQAIESSAGKDIRIYHMVDWFMKKYDEALSHMHSIFGCIHDWYFIRSLSDAVIGFLVDILAWGYLLYLLVDGQVTAAEFVLYLGLISGFGAYFENLIRQMMQLEPMSVSLGYIREFLEMENRWGDELSGKERLEAYKPVTVELCDVSYTYPGSDKPSLSHINLKINQGEKLAVLGLNGAGKTTLVKLICGFYQPTEGRVLVNGKPIRDYTRDSYYNMISVLFQDADMLPVTLDENLTGQSAQEIDRERLNWALSMSGVLDKYQNLPEKGNTLLVRELNEDALDYSGGEKQKFLFARALYKSSQLMILDEPTAALDPISENELYQNFSKAAEGRTSVYISHRLSSTRFCDRIILLENGTVVEEGTHDSLMEGGTRYAQLFELQSRYYKEQEKKKQRSAIMGDIYVEDAAEKEGIFHE